MEAMSKNNAQDNSSQFLDYIQYAQHIKQLSDANCRVLDVEQRRFVQPEQEQPDGHMCDNCFFQNCNPLNTHLYGCREAHKWQGKYIYYCTAGFVFVANTFTGGEDNIAGGLITGPIAMEEDELIVQELSAIHIEGGKFTVLSTRQVNSLSEIASAVVKAIDHNALGTHRGTGYQQDKFLTALYEIRANYNFGNGYIYPIETEKKLQNMIYNKDKAGAQLMLNDLLAHIYFSSDFDLDLIKARIIELIVIISRATIDAGADISEIFKFNAQYIKMIEQFNNIEDLSIWITDLMHGFISNSFDLESIKHSDVVFKVMEYIKSNYSEKITLEALANYVYLSKAYLSRIFKEETGENLTSCINRIRIEKSKLLLLDISVPLVDVANLCGYDDQSYFTKVFKRYVGMSPKQYRLSRGKK